MPQTTWEDSGAYQLLDCTNNPSQRRSNYSVLFDRWRIGLLRPEMRCPPEAGSGIIISGRVPLCSFQGSARTNTSRFSLVVSKRYAAEFSARLPNPSITTTGSLYEAPSRSEMELYWQVSDPSAVVQPRPLALLHRNNARPIPPTHATPRSVDQQ